MATQTGDSGRVATWITAHPRLLVLTHARPDGDAYGSLFAVVGALRGGGRDACGYLAEPLPSRYARFFPDMPVGVGQLPPGDRFDGVVCLDTSNAARIEWPDGMSGAAHLPICNIDHHGDNEQYGDCVWVDASAAATSEMLTLLLAANGWLTASAATCLLAGLIMDTGGFRFGNTTPAALRAAAQLADAGARYNDAMGGLFFREPRARRQLEAELVSRAVFAHDGRLVYAVLDSARVRELDLAPTDLEGLIDVIRTIDDVEIACLIQPEADGMRLSLRSRSPRFSVRRIAQTLGGGGHVMAAGARMPGASLAEAERALLDLTQEVLTET